MIVVRRNDSIAEKHPSGQNADSCGAEMRYFFFQKSKCNTRVLSVRAFLLISVQMCKKH